MIRSTLIRELLIWAGMIWAVMYRAGRTKFFGLFVLLVNMLAWGTISLADDGARVQEQFQAAQAKFESAQSPADFLETAKMFESILGQGIESGVVRFNLGNAYFRANEFGLSILNYRKANLLMPTNPYVQANLEQAISLSPGRLPGGSGTGWKNFLFWSDWLTPSAKIWVGSVGMSTVAVISLLSVWLRMAWLRIGGIAVFLLSGLILWDAWKVQQEIEHSKLGVVVAETVARKGTGDDYAPAFDQPLRDGAEFTVLSETSNWTFGRFEGVGDGWIRNEFVAR